MRLILSCQGGWSSLRRGGAFLIASARAERKIRFERTALGYCRECRKKVEILNPKRITFGNQRPAERDACPKCGTKVLLISGA